VFDGCANVCEYVTAVLVLCGCCVYVCNSHVIHEDRDRQDAGTTEEGKGVMKEKEQEGGRGEKKKRERERERERERDRYIYS
jgi:hypothetical protein